MSFPKSPIFSACRELLNIRPAARKREGSINMIVLVLIIFLVSMEELLDAASSRLPTLRGLKFTCYNLCDFGRCVINQGGKYQILYGRDEVR